MAQRSQRGKRKDERSTDDGMAWNGFECKWLECGTANCKMWMSMMVPDEVDMEHEVCQMWYVHCKGDECCERRERSVEEGSWRIEEGNWRIEEGSWRIKGAEHK